MKPTTLALVAASLLLPGLSQAQLSFNAGVTSDYRYRGISQTRVKPAVQGGLDYAAGSFYVGAWASTIKWVKDFGGDAGVELDLYGGYKGEVAKDLTLDVGVLTYQYPGNKLNPSANTTELYGALSLGPCHGQVLARADRHLRQPDSKNSGYLDLSASVDLGGGYSLVPHVGHQKITGPVGGPASYTDYSLTVSRDFSGVVLSAALIGTNADKTFYSSPANGKALGKSTLVLGAKLNF
jgi:uncharacterized protein (TIGR02001 family)